VSQAEYVAVGVALSRGDTLAVPVCVTVMDDDGDAEKDVDSVAVRVGVTEPVAEAELVAHAVAVYESEAATEWEPPTEAEGDALGDPDSVAEPVTLRALEGDTVEDADAATTVHEDVKEGE
jgi:hypothetical protein